MNTTTQRKNLLVDGRAILAYGEVSGHHHEMVAVEPIDPALDHPVQFFEEPDGRRVLIVLTACDLVHPEHTRVRVDPNHPAQIRQGDVCLLPCGPGVWEVRRQREYTPAEIRTVQD